MFHSLIWKDKGQAAILAANCPSTEELRQIMQQSLAEHNGRYIKELTDKPTTTERDTNYFKRQSVELEERCVVLEEKNRP